MDWEEAVNLFQRLVLGLGAFATLIAILHPPMVAKSASGHAAGHSFGWLLQDYDPQSFGFTYTVNVELLVVEVLAILAITGLLYLAFSPRRT